MMTKAIRAIVLAMLILGIADCAYSLDVNGVVKTINSDFDIVFTLDAEQSASIFSKYVNERKPYRTAFRQILGNRKQYSNETIINVINAIAISKDSDLLEDVKAISSTETNLNNVIHFYYYRIGYKKEKSFNYLKNKLDILVSNPTDGPLITFLPFFDDADDSLAFLNKLIPRSDGATAELLNWSINYLYFMNKHRKPRGQTPVGN